MNKMNNKGFSLVELIVVIAIMAVLMGVLAPTLIGNIEKSRESKDLQNLDTVYNAVNEALSNEAVAKECTGGKHGTLASFLSGNNSALADALKETLTTAPELTASCNTVANANIYVTIDANLKARVYVATSATQGAAATQCTKTKDSNNQARKMEVGGNTGSVAGGSSNGSSN